MNKKDFKWTEKRFGTTFANILKKLGGLSKDATDGSIEYKDDEGNITKLVTDSTFSSLLAKNGLIEVKWQELKNKRDDSKLIPGSLYRITDYENVTDVTFDGLTSHKFDIVLLALSNNILCEEGWAMMHDNIYDVTFQGSVSNPKIVRKCYIYCIDIENNQYNVVDCDTLLRISGTNGEGEDFIIDEINKTCDATDYSVDDLIEENLPYNYFQNSNLSVWKVWYCLDNDTDRFAWADDASDESITPSDNESSFTRDSNEDVDGLYAWTNDDSGDSIYTKTANPIVGDEIYDNEGTSMQLTISFITGFGRGVIYRLIDEFNNDVAYDFKNVQYRRKLTSGHIDSGGTNTWVYTLNYWNATDSDCYDASLNYPRFRNDEGGVNLTTNNKICPIWSYNFDSESLFEEGVNKQKLNDIVFAMFVEDYDYTERTENVLILAGYNLSFQRAHGLIVTRAKGRNYVVDSTKIDGRVLTENQRCVLENIP